MPRTVVCGVHADGTRLYRIEPTDEEQAQDDLDDFLSGQRSVFDSPRHRAAVRKTFETSFLRTLLDLEAGRLPARL